MSHAPIPCCCPLCGQPNQCELAASGNHEGPCWCWQETPDPEALRRIPEALRHKACLCRACLTGQTPRSIWDQWAQPLGAVALALLGLCWSWGPVSGAVIAEDFAAPPALKGWKIQGDTNLYQWNAASQNLAVTWDSAQPSNSFCWRPLGTVLSLSNDFSFAFDLRLGDLATGTTPGKPYTFQLALGLGNSTNFVYTNFFRGAGQNIVYGPRHLVEFDYFPETEVVDATFAPTVLSANNQFALSHNHPLGLDPGSVYRLTLNYTASNSVLRTTCTRDGQPFGLPPDNTLEDVNLASLSDYRLDAFAICNYTDRNQPPFNAAGSVRAHGVLDNLVITCPDPPLNAVRLIMSNGICQTTLTGQPQWLYTLQRRIADGPWLSVDAAPGAGVGLTLRDTNSPGQTAAMYRVKAEKP